MTAPKEVEEQAAEKRGRPESLLARQLLESDRPCLYVLTCHGLRKHGLAKVYEWHGRRVLAVPEIRVMHAFLYNDCPPEDTSEAILVPWAYDLSAHDGGPEQVVRVRCRCGTYSEKLSKLRGWFGADLLPGGRHMAFNYTSGANDRRSGASTL